MEIERNAIVINPLEYNPVAPPVVQAYENGDTSDYFELDDNKTKQQAYTSQTQSGLYGVAVNQIKLMILKKKMIQTLISRILHQN